jgi:dGTPase
MEVPLVARGWRAAQERYPDISERRLLSELVRSQIGLMVNDLIAETRRRIRESGIGTVEDVRAAGQPLVGFSHAMQAEERALKRFMYAELYHHQRQLDAAGAASTIVSGLFQAYAADPAAMPEGWSETLPAEDPDRSRHIADFIAGMTDRYAIARYRELVGDVELPEGF